MIEQYAIWTRYERPTGTIVRHVFGPYSTRSKAQTEMRRMTRLNRDVYGVDMDKIEVHVTKMVGDEPDAG